MDLISTRSVWLHPCTFWRLQEKVKACYWILDWFWNGFQYCFITLDSFNTYASIEPLNSMLHLSRTFTVICMIKEWNYLISFTRLRYYFWIFFIFYGNTIIFTTINWIVPSRTSQSDALKWRPGDVLI